MAELKSALGIPDSFRNMPLNTIEWLKPFTFGRFLDSRWRCYKLHRNLIDHYLSESADSLG